jgi:release factor glutamine methyltransferase
VTVANALAVGELVQAGLERREARWLVEEFGSKSDPGARGGLDEAARRRLAGEPLQYVLGHWPFRSLDLDLDARVLIPRPETEELVGIALMELTRCAVASPTILDLGCGSGAIGLAILAETRQRAVAATLIALDVSADALVVARRNALKHGLDAVSFVKSSWFAGLDESLRGQIDLIVANPPYVASDEFDSLDPVLAHEPRHALVAGDACDTPGFAELATIIEQAPRWLSDNGVLICEHGRDQREAALGCARAAGFSSVRDHDDLSGHPRILIATVS